MKTRKLKHYIRIYKWVPGQEHIGFTTPGEWTGPFYRQFKGPIELEAFYKKHKDEWLHAKASDGSPLYKVETHSR